MILILFNNCAENISYSQAFLDKMNEDYLNENKTSFSYSTYYLKEDQVVEFIIDSKDSKSKSYAQSLQQVCNYTKIPFKKNTIDNWNNNHFIINNTVRVICINNTIKLNDNAISNLLRFVANGGTLVIPNYFEDKRMGYFYGLKVEANYSVNSNAYGYYFLTNILPNHKGKKHKKRLLHNGLAKENFKNNVEVLASAINDPNYPVIIKNKIGKGEVVFFNSDTYFERNDRGLFFSSILTGLEGIAYPIANCATIFLDDFPATLYESKEEPIAAEFDLTSARFVDQIWWPDMQKLAQKYNIKYTTTITFNYNKKVNPPFLYLGWDELKKTSNSGSLSDWITKDVLKKHHELAFHGYNHVSLTKKNWEKENIELSLNTVKKKWVLSSYGKMPVTYIPPTNIIDEFGLQTLSNSLPTIKYICSAYSGSIKNGSGREFNPDPYNDKLFDFPRVCSGFYLNGEKYFNQQSVYLFTGIWTHFVHPDDVLQIPNKQHNDHAFEKRNSLGLGWYDASKGNTGMYYRFDSLLKKHKHTYPLSNYYTARKGAELTSKWRAESYKHTVNNNLYSVKAFNDNKHNNHWFVYVTDNNISRIEKYLRNNGLPFSKTSLLKGKLVQIKTQKPQISLPNLSKIDYRNIISENELIAFRSYDKARKLHFKKVLESEQNNEESIDSKIHNLRQQLFQPKEINLTNWNKYAKYKTWINDPLDVWDDLEHYYRMHNDPSIAAYSKELSTKIWYPNDSIQHLWLTRNIELNKNNLAHHKEYVYNYNTEDNSTRVIASLEEIATREPTVYNKEMYIKHLLWNGSNFSQSQLDKIEPSDQYSDVAKDVAWFYYNKNNLLKASAWSKHAKNIDIAVKLDWLFKTKQIDELKRLYKNHIQNSPNNDKAKIAMAYIYHSLGEFKNACLITESINNTYTGKNKLVKMLNNDIKYANLSVQIDLLTSDIDLFNTKIKDSLLTEIRVNNHNYISFSGDVGSDKANTSFFDKRTSYIIKGNQNFEHQISLNNSTLYQLKNTTIEEDNVDRDVIGIRYQLNNPEEFKKINYWVNVGVEKDLIDDEYLYNGSIGAKLSKEKNFISAQLQTFPVRNGPSYSKKIYRNNMSVYFEQKVLQTKGSLTAFTQGNYYSDDVFSNANTVKFQYNVYKLSEVTFKPFTEGHLSFASIDRVNSYPYWIINNRYFGGGGLGLTYGNQYSSKTFIHIDGAYFLDDYTDAFTRFTGNTSVRFFKYFVFTSSFEYYIQSQFYSNRFQFGLKYFLK
ncbi:DUF2194 domain-containing protein [Pseudofulvibacter geojedonensis]